jgi:ubiquinone/menaquinone biosynthesis C-methylase UbiE
MHAYEALLVARMFEPWGERLLDRLQVAAGQDVVDIACGTGSVTRLAAARVGRTGSVVGTDLSARMLAIAGGKPPVAGGAPISYRECPADALDLADHSADVVVCQHGLQFFPERHAALVEMHRVARPGARLGLAVWSEIDLCPPFAGLGNALEQIFGSAAATGFRDGPWGFPDAELLRAEIEHAGFSEVRVETGSLPVVFEGGAEQLLATVATTPIGQQVATLTPDGRAALVGAVGQAVASITDDAGAIRSRTTSNTALAVA